MKDKKRLFLVIGALLSVIVITVGVSFAFFNYAKLGSTENSVTTGTITFLYTEVDKVGAGIKLENAVPISDEAGKMLTGSGNVFNFKVTSTTPTNTSIPYEVTARMKKDSTLDKDVVKIYLTKGETEEEVLLDKYSNLTQTDRISENVAIEKTIYNGRVPSGSKNYEENFKLRMWVDSETDFSATTDEEGNTVYPYNNKTFTLTVNVYADAKVIAQEEVDMDNSAKIETVTAGEEVMETVDTETHNYEITLPEGTTSTTLNVETENPNSTIEIKKLDSIAINDIKSNVVRLSTAKTVPVSKGNNFFQVTVTSENKKIVNQYIINIIVEKNSDNTLKTLNLTNCTLSPKLDSNTTEYTCTVENNIESTTITAVANNQLSEVVTTTIKQLIVGKNTITIIVTAENGDSKTYTITVTRKASSDATLKSLSVSGYSISPTFSSSKTAYTLTVPYTVTSLTVNATRNNTEASVKITGNTNLQVGTNTVKIEVTAEDGSKKIYTITVTRQDDPKDYLSNKIISNNTILTDQSSTTAGLYKSTSTNSGDPTYYFKGNFKKNYVSFAGITWRIVRINEDGTIRLITDKNVSVDNSRFYLSATGAYTEMYYSSSNAKTQLTKWYNTNLSTNSSKIATGEYFCEQAKVKADNSWTVGSASLTHKDSYTPTFKCKPDANGHGLLNTNIGLITYDEIVLSGCNQTYGGYICYSSTGTFSDISTFSMSPAGLLNTSCLYMWATTSGLTYKKHSSSTGIRPVINLKADVEWASGTGESGTPYTIK